MIAKKNHRILIIGGSGFIGRNVVTRLATLGHSLCATFFRDTSFVEWVSQWPHVRVIQFDGTQDDRIFSDFDVCLYLAGNVNHNWAYTHPQEDLRINTNTLLNALSTFKGQLVYVSSGAVYYGLEGYVSPTTPVHPVFPYAISKYTSELYVQHLVKTGHLQGFTIVRLYYAYGPFEPRRRLIPTLIRKLLLENANTFTLNGNGQTFMAPLYVDDVAKALCYALFSPAFNQTVDLCSDHPLYLKDLVEQVCKVLCRQVRLEYSPVKEEIIRFWSSNDEARQLFNLDPPLSLTEGIVKYAGLILNMDKSR